MESSSPNHIDVVINKEKDNAWRFTGVYGALETQLRSATWDLIRSLHRRGTLPWLRGGNFNEILKSHEKRGGRLRPYSQMEQFRKVLDKCNLLDLGFLGNKFTWSRTYPNGGMVWERLDRAVCTAKWYDLFLSTSVQTLTCVSSDHNPICIQLEEIEVKTLRPWRFEQMWLKDSGCKEIVERTWDKSVTGSVTTPLHLCRYCPLWGLIPLTVLFSPKAHSSGGKGLYTLKGGHSL